MIGKIEKEKKEEKKENKVRHIKIKKGKKNMEGKGNKYIFIYIISLLFISCDDNVLGTTTDWECSSDCILDMDAVSLNIDDEGYYHMEFLDGYIQTFTTLSAFTNASEQDIYKVRFISNKEVNIEWMGQDNWTNLIDSHSYTDNNGYAYGVLGVYEEFVGDTITIYTGYEDNCSNLHYDSLKVVVD
tara:strand:- start:432 stop:989 length:558 start_codon:yes stop_codon:yes gene_type:complete